MSYAGGLILHFVRKSDNKTLYKYIQEKQTQTLTLILACGKYGSTHIMGENLSILLVISKTYIDKNNNFCYRT